CHAWRSIAAVRRRSRCELSTLNLRPKCATPLRSFSSSSSVSGLTRLRCQSLTRLLLRYPSTGLLLSYQRHLRLLYRVRLCLTVLLGIRCDRMLCQSSPNVSRPMSSSSSCGGKKGGRTRVLATEK